MKRMIKGAKTINKVVLLPVEEIQPNPAQPRKVFELGELEGLAQSIRENGLIQPITVRRKIEGGYQLVSGERRLKASKLVGMEQIPAIVIQTDDRQSAIYALIENMQRSDLNYFEEALAIQQLIQEWGITQEEAARRLSKAQSTIANKLRLLQFTSEQRKKLLEAGLSERHARALLKMDDPQQIEKTVYYISAKGLNVRQTEQYIEQQQAEKKEGRKHYIPVVKDVRLFLNTINRAIDVMKEAGVNATTEKIEKEDCIQYIVNIPRPTAS